MPFVMCVDTDFYWRDQLIYTEFPLVRHICRCYDILQQEEVLEFQYLFHQLNVLFDVS
jgi:hypothetical protein